MRARMAASPDSVMALEQYGNGGKRTGGSQRREGPAASPKKIIFEFRQNLERKWQQNEWFCLVDTRLKRYWMTILNASRPCKTACWHKWIRKNRTHVCECWFEYFCHECGFVFHLKHLQWLGKKNYARANSNPPKLEKRAPKVGDFAAHFACGFFEFWRVERTRAQFFLRFSHAGH